MTLRDRYEAVLNRLHLTEVDAEMLLRSSGLLGPLSEPEKNVRWLESLPCSEVTVSKNILKKRHISVVLSKKILDEERLKYKEYRINPQATPYSMRTLLGKSDVEGDADDKFYERGCNRLRFNLGNGGNWKKTR